jgi:hypothetical protein
VFVARFLLYFSCISSKLRSNQFFAVFFARYVLPWTIVLDARFAESDYFSTIVFDKMTVELFPANVPTLPTGLKNDRQK